MSSHDSRQATKADGSSDTGPRQHLTAIGKQRELDVELEYGGGGATSELHGLHFVQGRTLVFTRNPDDWR